LPLGFSLTTEGAKAAPCLNRSFCGQTGTESVEFSEG